MEIESDASHNAVSDLAYAKRSNAVRNLRKYSATKAIEEVLKHADCRPYSPPLIWFQADPLLLTSLLPTLTWAINENSNEDLTCCLFQLLISLLEDQNMSQLFIEKNGVCVLKPALGYAALNYLFRILSRVKWQKCQGCIFPTSVPFAALYYSTAEFHSPKWYPATYSQWEWTNCRIRTSFIPIFSSIVSDKWKQRVRDSCVPWGCEFAFQDETSATVWDDSSSLCLRCKSFEEVCRRSSRANSWGRHSRGEHDER